MMQIPGMITRSQAAKQLKCRRGTIDRLIFAGMLDVVYPYPGNVRHLLISASSLDAYIKRLQKGARPYNVAASLPARSISTKRQHEALPNLAEVAQRQAAEGVAL